MSADSLKDQTEEIVEISQKPVEFPSEIGSTSFEKKLLKFLVVSLQKGWTSVATHFIAKSFEVDKRELEKWAEKSEEVNISKGKKEGVFYLSLVKKEGTFSIGSDEFERELALLLTEDDDKIWKSSKYICKKLNVDEKEFTAWAYENKFLVRKLGKEDGVVYWGLVERFKPQKKADESKIPSSISEEEKIALAILHSACNTIVNTLNKYGNRLATRHMKSFKCLVKAQKELSSGIAILKNNLKIDDKSLPNLEEI